MNNQLYNPKDIKKLNLDELVNFYYQTAQEAYQPFLEASKNSKKVKDTKVAQITLSNHCLLNCVYCSFRKENSNQHYNLNRDRLHSILNKIKKENIKEIIIESGVDEYPKKHLLEIQEIQNSFSDLEIYLDIGSENYIAEKEFIQNFPVFIDYSPINKELRKEIQCFDNRNALKKQCSSSENIYGNFIVDIPGQDFKDLVQDLLDLIHWEKLKGIKIAPFYPQENTPYSIFGEACFLTTLKTISISRLLRPDWDIFISPEIHKLSYEDTMLKALLYGGNKEVIEFFY